MYTSLDQDSRKYAALKCFTKPFIIDQQDLTIQVLTKIYADIRLEVNKLTSVDHPHIVQFLGLCVISFSFLLEWAPRGDLDQIIDKYQDAEFPISPDTIATTILQVNILYVAVVLIMLLYRTAGFTCEVLISVKFAKVLMSSQILIL